jgi:hypothetical protein
MNKIENDNHSPQVQNREKRMEAIVMNIKHNASFMLKHTDNVRFH